MSKEGVKIAFEGNDTNQAFVDAVKSFPVHDARIVASEIVFESLGIGGIPKCSPDDQEKITEYINLCLKKRVDPFSISKVTYEPLLNSIHNYALASAVYYDCASGFVLSSTLRNRITALRLGVHLNHITQAVLNQPGFRRFIEEPIDSIAKSSLFHSSLLIVSPNRRKGVDIGLEAAITLIGRSAPNYDKGITINFPEGYDPATKELLITWMLNAAPMTRRELEEEKRAREPKRTASPAVDSGSSIQITSKFGIQ